MFTCLVQRRRHLSKKGHIRMGLSQQVIRLLPTHVAVRHAQLCRVSLLKTEPNDDQLSLRRQFSEIRKALRENRGSEQGSREPNE